MRLTDLDPKWLTRDGRRVGMVFRCPKCPREKNCHLSAFFEPVGPISGPDGQYALIAEVLTHDQVMQTHPCRRDFAWRPPVGAPFIADATFDNLSLAPSLDVPGCWHGFITNGEIC